MQHWRRQLPVCWQCVTFTLSTTAGLVYRYLLFENIYVYRNHTNEKRDSMTALKAMESDEMKNNRKKFK